jgi:hypothetical protein
VARACDIRLESIAAMTAATILCMIVSVVRSPFRKRRTAGSIGDREGRTLADLAWARIELIESVTGE